MNRKNFLKVGSAVAVLALGGVTGVAAVNKTALKAADATVWGHYDAVDPTLDTKGSKEYWVNCETHEKVYSAPSTGTIEDRGAPTLPQIYGFNDASEGRVIDKARNIVDFSAESDASIIIPGHRSVMASKTIVDGGVEGSKSLEIAFNNATGNWTIQRAYLDQVFSDPKVVGLAFNAKGNVNIKYMAYRDSTGATGVYDVRSDADTHGLDTTWKTFTWPRSEYEKCVANNFASGYQLAWLALSGIDLDTFRMYVSNIHPVTEMPNFLGADRGRNYVDDKGHVSYRDDNNKEAVKFWHPTADASNCGVDEEYRTEGGRSLWGTKVASSYFQIMLPTVWADSSIASDDVISIDVRSESAFNSNPSVKGMATGTGDPLGGAGYYLPANEWTTVRLTKAQMGGSVGGTALNFTGSPAGKIWVDNIHVIKAGTLNDSGFEDEHVLKQVSSTDWVYGGGEKRDYVVRIQNNSNSAQNICVSTSMSNGGSHSLHFNRGSQSETPLFIPSAKAAIVKNGGKVSFDLYTTSPIWSKEESKGVVTGMRGYLPDGRHPAGQWAHYELGADDITTDGRFLIFAGSNYGEFFLDNVVVTEA